MIPTIPNTLRIGRRTWRVFWHNAPDLPEAARAYWQEWALPAPGEAAWKRLWGLTIRPLNIIVLRRSSQRHKVFRALVHELGHASGNQRVRKWGNTVEEQFLHAVDRNLAQALLQLRWTRELRQTGEQDRPAYARRGGGSPSRGRRGEARRRRPHAG